MKLNVVLNATPFNQRCPRIRIYNNSDLIDDCELGLPEVVLEYNIEAASKNTLVIEFYNKSFGDNGVWDVDVNGSGEMSVKLVDLKLDDVSIGHLLSRIPFSTQWTENQLTYTTEEFKNQYTKYFSAGLMSFNGRLEFEYLTPVYEFLIESKYKIPYDPSRAFYSNSTELFHYERGLDTVDEIRSIIKSHE